MTSLRTARGRRRSTAPVAAVALILGVLAFAVPTPAPAAPPASAVGNTIHGFLLEHGVYRTIDHPDADPFPLEGFVGGSGAESINDRGDVVGTYLGADRRGRGYLRAGRKLITIDAPGAVLTEAIGVDDRRQVVGPYIDAAGTTHGYLRARKGDLTTLDVPGSLATVPSKINERGQVAGAYVDTRSVVHGFVWRKGAFTTIDAPGASYTHALGIDNRGRLVGVSRGTDDGALHGFLRDRHGRFTRIAPLRPRARLPPSASTSAVTSCVTTSTPRGRPTAMSWTEGLHNPRRSWGHHLHPPLGHQQPRRDRGRVRHGAAARAAVRGRGANPDARPGARPPRRTRRVHSLP